MHRFFMCVLTAMAVIALSACATIQSYRALEQPTGQTISASPGSTVFRLNRTADLPNAFGKADLYGGKTDRGFSELKFLGLTEAGHIIFSVLEVSRASSETTMDRYGGRTQIQTNVTVGGGDGATRFVVDPTKQSELVVSGVKVNIVQVLPYSISYTLQDTQQ